MSLDITIYRVLLIGLVNMLAPCHTPGRVECGVDEVGRGCLAGPVVAAAVVWRDGVTDERVRDIKDSKKLSAKKRKVVEQFIKDNAVAWSVKFVDNRRIDEVNILQATYQAMHACIDEVCAKVSIDHLLVDGNRFKPYGGIPHTCVVKGDNAYISIAAASILAKVARDEYMVQLADENPSLQVYKWGNNMGYGTVDHVAAIQAHGMSEYHRRSFKLRKMT
jgi:ribonuclease HII